MAAGYIMDADPEDLQPSSLDPTITEEIYRMRGSYVPRPGEPIRELVTHGALYRASLDYPLERGGTYLIRLRESLKLPATIHATVSNKSSSGRIDLRTRVIIDGCPRYDSIPAGYTGSLWMEVTPKSFPVKLHAGDRVNQIRFFYGNAKLNALEHQFLYDRYHVLRTADGRAVPPGDALQGDGVTMTIDLLGAGRGDKIIGWRSHPGAWNVLDTHKANHNPRDFFEPILRPDTGELTLTPGTFYILNTKEKIIVPPEYALQMASYDPSKGEFRSHFAGFFDPGWGWHDDDSKRGAAAVLEVEAFGQESVIRDGQPICLMVYERMLSAPTKLYGADLKSNYHMQTGPRLAKWFAVPEPEPKSEARSSVPPKPASWDNLGILEL